MIPWQVRIISGAPIKADEQAPLRFGAPTMTIGDEGLSDIGVELEYGPVLVVGDASALSIMMEAEAVEHEGGGVVVAMRMVRAMLRPLFEFGRFGEIYVEGFEEGEDHTLRLARWEITPFQFEPGDESDGEEAERG